MPEMKNRSIASFTHRLRLPQDGRSAGLDGDTGDTKMADCAEIVEKSKEREERDEWRGENEEQKKCIHGLSLGDDGKQVRGLILKLVFAFTDIIPQHFVSRDTV